MKVSHRLRLLTVTALLSACAIAIPMVMPIKLIIPPASYTLASHVPIFLAMMLAPGMARFVTMAAALGFFISGMPLIIVYRAISHILFVWIGTWYMQSYPGCMKGWKERLGLNISLGVIHSLGEVLACFFFFGVDMTDLQGAWYTIGVLVGVGTFVHSLVDFTLAWIIYRVIPKGLLVSGYEKPLER